MKGLFTMEECKEQLQLGVRQINRYLQRGELEYTKIKGKRYITVESVAKLIRKRSQEVKNNE